MIEKAAFAEARLTGNRVHRDLAEAKPQRHRHGRLKNAQPGFQMFPRLRLVQVIRHRRHSANAVSTTVASLPLFRLPNRLLTKTKKTGTKNTANTVAEIIPPNTPVPMAFWL